MDGLDGLILSIVRDGQSWQIDQVHHRLRVKLNRAVHDDELSAALNRLRARQLVSISEAARTMRRQEPDFLESELEEGVEAYLLRPDTLKLLRIQADRYVFQKTTTGGARGGTWSQPDFTLAAIRAWRFDPRRYLDVFSFELKNRDGAGVMGVYEAHAHGRFVHFPYFVCPRLGLKPDLQDSIERECAGLGVGLIQFDLECDDDGRPSLVNFDLVLTAERREPDPERVEGHLQARLTADNAARLSRLARDA